MTDENTIKATIIFFLFMIIVVVLIIRSTKNMNLQEYIETLYENDHIYYCGKYHIYKENGYWLVNDGMYCCKVTSTLLKAVKWIHKHDVEAKELHKEWRKNNGNNRK